MITRSRRVLSGALCALLVLLSPGLGAYAAAADVFKHKPALAGRAAKPLSAPRALPPAIPPGRVIAVSAMAVDPALPTPAPGLDAAAIPAAASRAAEKAAGRDDEAAATAAPAPRPSEAPAEASWVWGNQVWRRLTGLREVRPGESAIPAYSELPQIRDFGRAAAHVSPLFFPEQADIARVPPSGGAALPPGNGRPPAPPPQTQAKTRWQKIVAAVSSLWRILPDKDRNKEFWKVILYSTLGVLGVSFHYPALNGLLANDGAKVLGSRVVTYGADAASSLSLGPAVNNSPIRKVIGLTYGARSGVMAVVPALFFALYFANPALLPSAALVVPFMAVLFVNSFLSGAGIVAGSMAHNALLAGYDTDTYNRAEAYFGIMMGIAQLVGFIGAGFFIGAVSHLLAIPHAGSAVAYGVYALFLAGAAVVAGRFLKLPKNPHWQARKELAEKLRGERLIKRVSAELLENRQEVLVVEMAGAVNAPGVPNTFNNYPVQVIPQRRVVKELLEGFRLIAKDRFFRTSMLFATLCMVISDALVFSTLQRYIKDSLKLDESSGAFSYFFAAMAIGQIGASLLITRSRAAANKAASAPAVPGEMTPLDKQGRWSSFLNGLGMLCYWGVFFAPNLWMSVAFMAVGFLLQSVANIIWTTLERQVLRQYPRNQGKIIAAKNFYHTLCAITGLFLFLLITPLPFTSLLGVTIPNFPLATSTVLWISCLALSVVALLDFIEPLVVLPLNRAPKKAAAEPKKP